MKKAENWESKLPKRKKISALGLPCFNNGGSEKNIKRLTGNAIMKKVTTCKRSINVRNSRNLLFQ